MMAMPMLSLVLILLLQVSATQQPSAFLEGAVVDRDAGNPLSRATVEIREVAGDKVLAFTQTDAEGRFFFPAVAASEVRLTATRSGYVKTEYGQRRPGGPALSLRLTPGGRSRVELKMVRAGVISGRLTDKGQPVGLADVIAFKAIHNDGQLQTTPVLSTGTDDLGNYSLFWLPPGRYYVMAIVWDTARGIPRFVNPDGDNANSFYQERRSLRAVLNRAIGSGAAPNEAHIPIWFPGTPDPLSAAPIDIRPGTEIRNIDIEAGAMPTRRVRGIVSGLPVNATTQPFVQLVPIVGTLLTNDVQSPSTPVQLDGAFEIPRVTPGSFMLVATAGNQTARVPVEVRERDVDNVFVALGSGFRISGRISTDGPALPGAALSGMRIVLRGDPLLPGAPVSTSGPIGTDGAFEIAAPSGNYRVLITPLLTAPLPPGVAPPALPEALRNFYVKAVRLGENDVLHDGLRLGTQPQEPLTVVIATNGGAVEGRAVTPRGDAASAVSVVLMPETSLRFRVQHLDTFTDASGRFRVSNVPPGRYRVFAFEDVERGAWHDPNFMRPLNDLGTLLQVSETATTAASLTSIPPQN
jgi:hypothetical protein